MFWWKIVTVVVLMYEQGFKDLVLEEIFPGFESNREFMCHKNIEITLEYLYIIKR